MNKLFANSGDPGSALFAKKSFGVVVVVGCSRVNPFILKVNENMYLLLVLFLHLFHYEPP